MRINCFAKIIIKNQFRQHQQIIYAAVFCYIHWHPFLFNYQNDGRIIHYKNSKNHEFCSENFVEIFKISSCGCKKFPSYPYPLLPIPGYFNHTHTHTVPTLIWVGILYPYPYPLKIWYPPHVYPALPLFQPCFLCKTRIPYLF